MISNYLPSGNLIPFNQQALIDQLHPIEHRTLLSFYNKYDGLCDLICNFILLNGYLDNIESISDLKNRVKLEHLNHDRIKKSHLLDVFSIFQKAIAFLFGIFPDNIFSIREQWNLVQGKGRVKMINKTVLEKGLHRINKNEYLKVEVFKKNFLSFYGHSLLLKKVSDNEYILFDPNKGAERYLPLHTLIDLINLQLISWEGTDLYITKAESFKEKLKNPYFT